MATWSEFVQQEAVMAAHGQTLLRPGIAYLATTRKDGSPRVHPVTPILCGEGVYVAIPESSPKGRDLLRDGRYALHALPGPNDDEFMMAGRVRLVDDPAERQRVKTCAHHVIHDTDRVFEFRFDRALWGYWENVGQPNTRPVRQWWHEGSPRSSAGA